MAAHERVVGETLADPNSYGFRPQRSTADAIGYCFNALAKYSSPEWVLEGGIRGCFDNFSHDWLVRNIPMDKALLQRWLQAGFIEKGALFATEAGTPQGGITILQLVEPLRAARQSPQTSRGDHQSTALVTWGRHQDPTRRTDHAYHHQPTRETGRFKPC